MSKKSKKFEKAAKQKNILGVNKTKKNQITKDILTKALVNKSVSLVGPPVNSKGKRRKHCRNKNRISISTSPKVSSGEHTGLLPGLKKKTEQSQEFNVVESAEVGKKKRKRRNRKKSHEISTEQSTSPKQNILKDSSLAMNNEDSVPANGKFLSAKVFEWLKSMIINHQTTF